MFTVVAGAMIFAVGKASAFPLKLMSVSGTLSVTPSYDAITNVNKAKITTASFNLKKLMTVITNQVFLYSGTNPPAGSYVVYDPYLFRAYLTNKTGYYYNLSDIVDVGIEDIATSFSGNDKGGTENDKCTVYIDIYGHGPDGKFYEADIYCLGSITASYKASTDTAHVSISAGGLGYGEYQTSDDGVAKGSFSLKGSGTPPAGGIPYSIWWWYED